MLRNESVSNTYFFIYCTHFFVDVDLFCFHLCLTNWKNFIQVWRGCAILKNKVDLNMHNYDKCMSKNITKYNYISKQLSPIIHSMTDSSQFYYDCLFLYRMLHARRFLYFMFGFHEKASMLNLYVPVQFFLTYANAHLPWPTAQCPD